MRLKFGIWNKKSNPNISSFYFTLTHNGIQALVYIISWNKKVLTHSELKITRIEDVSIVKQGEIKNHPHIKPYFMLTNYESQA